MRLIFHSQMPQLTQTFFLFRVFCDESIFCLSASSFSCRVDK